METGETGDKNLREFPTDDLRTVDCYHILSRISAGQYAEVFKAEEKETGEIVALKKIKILNKKEGFPNDAINEITILKRLHHENIIKLKEVVVSPVDNQNDERAVYLVLEYMAHDLENLADLYTLSAGEIKCFMKQLLQGLHYCHTNHVIHCDIKADNILIDSNGILKLADFGISCLVEDSNSNRTNIANALCYRPPELLLGSTEYGPAVDIWSVGCLFGKLLTGQLLFDAESEGELLNLISELCGTPNESCWPGVSDLPSYHRYIGSVPLTRQLKNCFTMMLDFRALDLLDKMLTLDPSQRISAGDALNARYFRAVPLPIDPKSLPKYESTHTTSGPSATAASGSNETTDDPLPIDPKSLPIYESSATAASGSNETTDDPLPIDPKSLPIYESALTTSGPTATAASGSNETSDDPLPIDSESLPMYESAHTTSGPTATAASGSNETTDDSASPSKRKRKRSSSS